MGIPQDKEDKGLKGKANRWLSPLLGAAEIIVLWQLRIPLLILIFTSVASFSQSIRDWNDFQTLLFPLMKRTSNSVAKFTSLVRLGTNLPGPCE